MKSWKNRRNTYWILIATAFGLLFPGNQASHYRNLIGLVFCWALYLFCFVRNNREVEEQEQREKEEQQKRVEVELAKKEKERALKKKKDQWFYESIECPKIIKCIMDKYNRDWEKDLYPRDARYHLNDIKRQIESEVENEKRNIRNYEITIEQLKELRHMHSSQYEQAKIDDKINGYLYCIDKCQEHIRDIPNRYNSRIEFYQEKIDGYKDQCREHEQKANELLLNSPEEIIKAIDCHLSRVEEVKKKPKKNSRYGSNDKWVKNEEAKLPYLMQAKLDAIDRIKELEKASGNELVGKEDF